MKFFTVLTCVLISIVSASQGQQPVLYGTTTSGNGGIFKYTAEDNSLKNEYRLKNAGIYRRSHMVSGTDGVIYGVALGGPYGQGIIFSLDPATNKYVIRKNFQQVDGAVPNSALVRAGDGKLYGTTLSGGHNGNGVLFSFDPVTSVYRVLLHYNDVFASSPGALTVASDGLLYGIANVGLDLTPLIYSFNPETKEFNAQTVIPEEFGFFPSEGMIEGANDGMLYGVMSFGGANSGGTLYSYSLSTKQLTKRFDFNSNSGINPNGRLTMGPGGKLYSTTTSGGANTHYGTVFCFDPLSNSVKVLHDFNGTNGGSSRGGLAVGTDGKLYGMTLKLVPKGRNFDFIGSIFYSIDMNGENYTVIRDFDHGGRSLGEGNFILVGQKLYGIASAERRNPYEYIFSYDSKQDLFQKIIRTNQDKGYEPRAGLLQASDGRFYGIAHAGGGFGLGGIFSFNPGTRQYTMLMPFNPDRGYLPGNKLVQAANGTLYGVTKYGGRYDHGVLFSFDPQTSRYYIEKNFKNSRPVGELALAKDGKLYSHLELESSEYQLFSFDPLTRQYKELDKIYDAEWINFSPASDGKIYSTSAKGIYSYDPALAALELITFPDITFLSGSFVEGADHKLYSLSAAAGETMTLYSFDPSDRSYASVELLTGTDGYYNTSELLSASDGKLYGTISENGDERRGSLFSFDPGTQAFQILSYFDRSSGGIPGSGPLVELDMSIAPIVSITDQKKFEGETANLTVSLNRISMEPVTLNYHSVAGTANQDGKNPDYIPASGQVMIPPGEISTTISIPLLEDELLETREWFTVVLQKANEFPVVLGDSISIINIKNGQAPIIPPGGEIITIAPMPGTATESIVKDELVIRALPNPTSSFFSLHISGRNTDRVSVTVTNLSGQILDKFDRGSKNSSFTFGHNYKPGSYFVRILDGEKTKVIKLIKTSK